MPDAHEPLDVDEAQDRLDELGDHIAEARHDLLDEDGDARANAMPIIDEGALTASDDSPASDAAAEAPG